MPAKKQAKPQPAKPPEAQESKQQQEELIKVLMLDPVMTSQGTFNAGTEQEIPVALAEEWEQAGFARVLES